MATVAKAFALRATGLLVVSDQGPLFVPEYVTPDLMSDGRVHSPFRHSEVILSLFRGIPLASRASSSGTGKYGLWAEPHTTGNIAALIPAGAGSPQGPKDSRTHPGEKSVVCNCSKGYNASPGSQ